MPKVLALLFPAVSILAGCASAEDRMVDLSAIVFVIYLALILFKYSAPRITGSSFYKRVATVIASNNTIIWRTLSGFGVALVILAPMLGGIHRILLFAGFVLLIIGFAFRMGAYADETNEIKSRLPFEIITLGLGVLFVLLMMWFVGAEMFVGF